MSQRFLIASVCFVVALPILGGCTTTSKNKTLSNHITMNSGAYSNVDTRIDNDIKEILSHGGVSVASAPTTKPKAMPETPKVLSNTATNLESLVAQLSNTPTTPTMQAEIPQQKNTALALVSDPKPRKISNTATTTVFEAINIPTPIASPKPRKENPVQVAKKSEKTSRVTITPKSSYKTPTVKRF